MFFLLEIGMLLLTSDDHHARGEYLFVVCFSGNVSKANARHAGHGEVESCDIHRLAAGSVD